MIGAADTVGPVRAFWRWNVSHSPIARRVRPNRYARRLLDAAALPAPIAARIDTIVRRSCLWAHERGDVARELIAHARDAADAGRSEPEVLASLGDPRPVARLIRRAMKRKRPWVYQARVWTTRALACGFVLVFLGYGALAVRFYTSRPSVKVNYLARLNARTADYPDNQKAKPVYDEVRLAWYHRSEQIRDLELQRRDDAVEANLPVPEHIGLDLLPHIPPDHPDYQEVRDLVVSFRPELDRLVAATERPVIGLLYSDRYEEWTADQGPVMKILPPATDPQDQGWLFEVLLPDLGGMRAMARLLQFDAKLAADEGDGARAAADIGAIANISRQLGQEPFLISNLVSIAVHNLACVEAVRLVDRHPELVDADALAAISHELAAARGEITLRLDSEQDMFEDFLQRGFTDDGRGNGHITPAGVGMLTAFDSTDDSDPDKLFRYGENPADWSPASRAAAPTVQLAVADRRTLSNTYERLMGHVHDALEAGPSSLATLPYETGAWLEGLPPVRRARLAPIVTLMPAMEHSVASYFRWRASADATLTVLAIEAYRRRTGEVPATLADLPPALLPAVPPDPFDPGGLIKYRVRADNPGGYVVYFNGADGDDDGGVRPGEDDAERDVANLGTRYDAQLTSQGGRMIAVPLGTPSPKAPDGDWVIYPPPADD